MTRQTLNFSPVLTQTCISLNEVDQAVFAVFNMEIRENEFKISPFLWKKRTFNNTWPCIFLEWDFQGWNCELKVILFIMTIMCAHAS